MARAVFTNEANVFTSACAAHRNGTIFFAYRSSSVVTAASDAAEWYTELTFSTLTVRAIKVMLSCRLYRLVALIECTSLLLSFVAQLHTFT